jgi:xylose dehydrogenase (NAD/NADP)
LSAARLRWGVLGAADIAAKAVVPAIQAAGDEVLVLGSREREKGELMAGQLRIPAVVQGYQEVLKRDLDAIYIPLPNSLHYRWAMAALEGGKHVLCEKPLTLTVAEATEVDTVARRLGLVVAEAVMYRYHPRWRLVLELLRKGRIGAPQQVTGGFNFTLKTAVNVRWDRELGGGALYDVGSYLVNAARWVVGKEPQRAVAVASIRDGVDESTTLLLDFGEEEGRPGATAALSCSFAAAESQWLRILGSEGCLLLPKPFTAWHGEALPVLIERSPGEEPERVEAPAADPYREMVLAFGDSVRSGGISQTSAADAAGTLAVLEACQRSFSTGAFEPVTSCSAQTPP